MPKTAHPRFDENNNQWTIYHGGRYHYLCMGRGNESIAWQRAERLKGTPLDSSDGPPRTVTQATHQWLKQRGTAWHERILGPFMQFGYGTLLSNVHADYLDDYLLQLTRSGYERQCEVWTGDGETRTKVKRKTQHPYSPSTLLRQVRFARTVLRSAHVRGYMERPVPDMPKIPPIEEVDRSIDEDSLRKILSELPLEARQVLTFQVLVGCRPGEACGLRFDEVHGDTCILRRGKTFRRTGQPRVIHLNGGAKELITKQPRTAAHVFLSRLGEPYKPSGLRSILKRAAERAGYSVTGAYQLRHTFAQAAYDSGLISEGSLGELMGHRPNSPATKQYVRNRARRAVEEAKALGSPVSVDLPPSPGTKSKSEKADVQETAPPSRRKTARGRLRRTG